MSLILLASYPKSGNTWMRTLLSNYLAGDGKPVSINALITSQILSRHQFDEWLGLTSAAMTRAEILRHRPRFHEFIATEADSPAFAKVHQPFQRLPGGAPLFSPPAIAGAVCIVRNPLDIAVSFAHHLQWDIDRTIAAMADPNLFADFPRNGIHHQLPDPYRDWSGNVSSWLDQDILPLRLVSYENLQADPEAALDAVLAFAGRRPDGARLARAAEFSRFQRLREAERREGFREKQPTAPSFFRKGRIGDWRGALSRQQVQRLVDSHGSVMARLGYLEEAEQFLTNG